MYLKSSIYYFRLPYVTLLSTNAETTCNSMPEQFNADDIVTKDYFKLIFKHPDIYAIVSKAYFYNYVMYWFKRKYNCMTFCRRKRQTLEEGKFHLDND